MICYYHISDLAIGLVIYSVAFLSSCVSVFKFVKLSCFNPIIYLTYSRIVSMIDLIDFWCFNATFSNISAISWRSVLVVEEAGVHGEKH